MKKAQVFVQNSQLKRVLVSLCLTQEIKQCSAVKCSDIYTCLGSGGVYSDGGGGYGGNCCNDSVVLVGMGKNPSPIPSCFCLIFCVIYIFDDVPALLQESALSPLLLSAHIKRFSVSCMMDIF